MERASSKIQIDSPIIALNNKSKKNLEIIKDRLHVAAVLCSKSSIFYGRMKMFLIVPNLLLSSTAAFINNQQINHETLKIVNTIINGLTILLIGLQTSFRISEQSDLFKNSSNAFIKILHDIEAKECSDLITPDFIISSTQQYDQIMSNLSDFPRHIRENVRNEYGGMKHLPIIINGITKTFIEPQSPSSTFVVQNELV
jgi:hypothetical protein